PIALCARGAGRGHLRVTATARESISRPRNLLAAAGLAWSAAASAHASSPCRTANIQPSLPEISGSSNDGSKAGLFDRRIIAAVLIAHRSRQWSREAAPHTAPRRI